ncbi:MAG TPA: hypothetical protein VFM65_04240 [Flavobacteriaceae bacterium]|nr:hypothetical protein [Flavobacteriaceae bacterium]
MKFFKFFEYAYLAFAAFFVFEAVRTFNQSPNRSYLFLAIAALAVFMFFFKRRFRKKMEQRNQK